VGVAYNSGQSSLFVDVTIDGDASSSCTTSDDVTTSDDIISNPGSDVTESPQQAVGEQAQPAGGAWSEDSGHCSGASDVTVTSSSDTETLDAEEEEKDDVDDDDEEEEEEEDDNESQITSETVRRRRSTVTSCDSQSILDLLAHSCRVTDLWRLTQLHVDLKSSCIGQSFITRYAALLHLAHCGREFTFQFARDVVTVFSCTMIC